MVIVAPVLVGMAVEAPPAAACHGVGVSRSCDVGGGVTRLEAVSYTVVGAGTAAFSAIYTYANYFQFGSLFFYGDNTCFWDWRCVHGLYEGGTAIMYQVQGDHWFDHTDQSGWYTIGWSFTDGQCLNVPTVAGC
jgi:hypothetical protein